MLTKKPPKNRFTEGCIDGCTSGLIAGDQTMVLGEDLTSYLKWNEGKRNLCQNIYRYKWNELNWLIELTISVRSKCVVFIFVLTGSMQYFQNSASK